MRRARSIALRALACIALCSVAHACSSDDEAPKRTAILVRVSSMTLDVPDDIDEVRVLVRSERADDAGFGQSTTAKGQLGDGGVDLPVHVLLEPGPGVTKVQVTAQAFLGETLVVEQVKTADFAANQTLLLPLELEAACAEHPPCDEGETCVVTNGVADCEDSMVDELAPVGDGDSGDGDGDGSGGSGGESGSSGDGDGDSGDGDNGDGDGGDGDAGPTDGGVDAGDAGDAGCAPIEICNGVNDDCDDFTDEGDGICPAPEGSYATFACEEGECVATCLPQHFDCDLNPDDCESPLSMDHCGGCDANDVCLENQTCRPNELDLYQCQTGGCEAPFPDFCAEASTCTDLDTEETHCGDCDTACEQRTSAVPSCEGGECVLKCMQNFHNCDDDESDGCESNENSDVNNCGGCASTDDGVACPEPNGTVASCNNGDCALRCEAGRLDCDADDDCEADWTAKATCGGCTACTSAQVCCPATANNPPRCGLLNILSGLCI